MITGMLVITVLIIECILLFVILEGHQSIEKRIRKLEEAKK